MKQKVLGYLLRLALRSENRKRRILRAVFWSVATAVGLYMVGCGVWALLQPWGSAWQKLFAFGFLLALTLVFIYQLFITLSPTSLIANLAVQDFISGCASLLFAISCGFVMPREDATTAEIAAGSLGIVFFGLGGIMLIRSAKSDWKRR